MLRQTYRMASEGKPGRSQQLGELVAAWFPSGLLAAPSTPEAVREAVESGAVFVGGAVGPGRSPDPGPPIC
jgi:hypothetical protein